MGRIPLTAGFTIMPEGEHILRIYDLSWDEEFGKLIIKLINAKGVTVQERFTLKDANEEYNNGALNAFSNLAKAALDDEDAEDVDPEDLIDHYIKAEIVHAVVQDKNDPSKSRTFANIRARYPAPNGFEGTATNRALNLGRNGQMKNAPKPQAQAAAEPAPAQSGLDLDALLG
jgi:hypothetical protein